MKKLRYLIAAALAAGSMAVCAGAVRTVTPQEALQSSIAQVQQQWQNENDKSMYFIDGDGYRSEEHTSELQSLTNLVCRLLLETKKKKPITSTENHA